MFFDSKIVSLWLDLSNPVVDSFTKATPMNALLPDVLSIDQINASASESLGTPNTYLEVFSRGKSNSAGFRVNLLDSASPVCPEQLPSKSLGFTIPLTQELKIKSQRPAEIS